MQIDPNFFRLVSLRTALDIHVKTGGKMRLTRTATPTNILKMASEYTGKQYRRGQQAQALADIRQVVDVMRAKVEVEGPANV